MSSYIRRTLLIATSTTMLCNLGTAYADDKPYGAHADISGKYSSARSLSELELFIPLAQSSNTLLFADVRGMMDTKGSKEGNFGLGLRHIVNDKVIIGGYGFYDRRRSSNSFTYNQFTLGAEIMTEKFDLRFNYYDATNDFRELNRISNTIATGESVALSGDPYLSGNAVWSGGLLEHTTTTDIFGEKALDGWDIEAGVEVFKGLRGFGGYYKFTAPNSEDVMGPKARIEWNIGDSFNKDTKWKISLNAEITDDKVRGTNAWGGIRLRIPFGGKHAKSSSNSRLMNRMTETIRRDVDVVTGATATQEITVEDAPVVVQLSNADMSYWFVNNTASGDGSFENPFATLTQAQTASGENDIIFVYAGDGTSTGYDNGFIMQYGQSLIGEYMGLAWQGVTLIDTGDRPLLTNLSEGFEAILTLRNDNWVSGLHMDGNNTAYYGIFGNDVSGIFIFESNIVENNKYGIDINTGGQYTDIVISGNTISNNGYSGIEIQFSHQYSGSVITNIVISGNTISNNVSKGINIGTSYQHNNSVSNYDITILDNIVTNHYFVGIQIGTAYQYDDSVSNYEIMLSGNTVANNGIAGSNSGERDLSIGTSHLNDGSSATYNVSFIDNIIDVIQYKSGEIIIE